MRRRASGPTELEALDPRTGESLSASDDPAAASSGSEASSRAGARRVRLRRLAVLCVVLAIGCGAAAGYFAVSIAQLRGVERTWRSAIALDTARADADRQVLDLLGAATSGEDDQGTLAPLGAIGTEVASGLRRYERALADRRILDSKVSDLRDAMVDALEFRRFQLSPTRSRIGDTPLQRVEEQVAGQLDRWELAPSRVDEPELASLAGVLAQLRRYADIETGTTLFALDGTTLHTIDVDGSTIGRREVPFTGDLIGVTGGVAIGDGRLVVVYPPDPAADPIAVIEDTDGSGSMAVAAGDGSGDLWVVQQGGATVRRFRVEGESSGWFGEAVRLPLGTTVVGSTFDHLVLDRQGAELQLWSPSSGSPVATLATEGARYLAAEGQLVLFQGPLPFSPRDSSDFLHRAHAGTGRRDLIGLPRTDVASADISRSGIAAVAAGPLAGRLGSILLLEPDATALVGGGAGPRASVEPGAVAWSEDGASLFWLTPDGEVAIAHGTRPGTKQLLRTGLRGLDRLAVLGR